MAEELSVVLRRTNENSGLGFSLLGTAGLPPIIYDIVENSPAAESGEVEAGDVILKVNETDVNRFSTKEVLRCLRLSEDPIRLILKRDPIIKEKVVNILSGLHGAPQDNPAILDESTSSEATEEPTKSSAKPEEPFVDNASRVNHKAKTPRFEAYMMTGDLILNLSRTQQTSGILPKRQKKIDSLSFRYRNKNTHRYDQYNSVPTSPNESDLGLRKRSLSSPSESPTVTDGTDTMVGASCYGFHMGVRTSRSEDHLQCQKNSSVSTVDIDIDDDIRSSLNTLLDTRHDSGSILDQFNAISERIALIQGEDRSSDSLDVSSNTTVLHVTEKSSNAHSETVKCGKTSESQTVKQLDDGKGINETHKNGGRRKSGHFEKCNLGEKHDKQSESSKHCEKGSPKTDRIVWTYNAPRSTESPPSHSNCDSISGSENNICCASTLSSCSSSQRSLSPASPTSVSSSIMSSNSNSLQKNQQIEIETKQQSKQNTVLDQWNPSDMSASEAVSNISSPDYQEEITMDILNARDMLMEISDPSDSDSTLLVSHPLSGSHNRTMNGVTNGGENVAVKGKLSVRSSPHVTCSNDHKIVIQVKGPEGSTAGSLPKQKDGVDETNVEEVKQREGYDDILDDRNNKSPSQSLSGSDEESDIESLHSFHYSPKAVDLPSAIRLAKRLYTLDGFKKSDVSRHLSKNNDFSRAVAEEYLKHFTFTKDTLDTALRKFLKQFSLTGETQERERVLVHFSKRYLECNPGSFNSQDAVHTLTCALMLLNTDLNGQNISRKMTCEEFIDNLRDLNEGENFPRDILKALYQAIKTYPLEWALDDDADQVSGQMSADKGELSNYYNNPFLGIPNMATAIEYKKGCVMRKSCVEPNGKKTPFGKRGWKMFYCTLRDLVLYLHKDEHGFRKNQLTENLHNAIRIHHSLATKATDYTKKEYVFRLETAEQAEYLFQTGDAKELQSWIDTINFVCASYSSQPLASGVGSENKFQRPLFPCSHTKLNLREQLADHEDRVQKLELALEEHRRDPPDRSSKPLFVQNYKEKDAYLLYEIKRYKTYVSILRLRMPQYADAISPNSLGDDYNDGGIVPPPVPDRRIAPSNR
ncbi:hypothetical protein RUM44_004177 [Polyplax serrata]|uniref:PH and SEC7 domain-containing protein 3 n=1 Tax=Polyplax serrata TaxID=468196 RepID=A0ABR1B246_POLSC